MIYKKEFYFIESEKNEKGGSIKCETCRKKFIFPFDAEKFVMHEVNCFFNQNKGQKRIISIKKNEHHDLMNSYDVTVFYESTL